MRISDWSSDVCSSDLDLRRRAAVLAGAVLEIGGKAEPGQGVSLALATLVDGHAWTTFAAICETHGGMRTPPVAAQPPPNVPPRAGRVVPIDSSEQRRVGKERCRPCRTRWAPTP